jgi:hypothetical protein
MLSCKQTSKYYTEKLLHQVGDLFELNVKLRCQKVNIPKKEPWVDLLVFNEHSYRSQATRSKDQSPSDVDSYSVRQETAHILRTLHVHCCSQQLASSPYTETSKTSPRLPNFKISLNIVLISTPKSFKSATVKTLYEFLLLPYEVSRPSWYASPGNSYDQRSKHANVKIIFLHAICLNSDTLRSILIIFRELHQYNIYQHGWIITYIKICPKCFAGITQ